MSYQGSPFIYIIIGVFSYYVKVMLGMAASWLYAAWRCPQPFVVSSTLEFRAAVWGWQRGRTLTEDQGIELALQVRGHTWY